MKGLPPPHPSPCLALPPCLSEGHPQLPPVRHRVGEVAPVGILTVYLDMGIIPEGQAAAGKSGAPVVHRTLALLHFSWVILGR